MHTLAEMSTSGTHVPAFLAKLWKLVDDPTTNDLIYWSESGNSFIIWNQAKFSRDLLPLYYKHNNMASFVRQLNMYGFHKVVSVEQGGLKVDKDEMEFAHPFFLRGQETSLELIKRKIPAAKAEDARIRPDSIQKVLMDVRQMKGRQENMDSKLVTMKRENEALWRELAALRQKHAKQTQIVSKLLQFLVGMMSSSQAPRLGFKRRMPLMLNDFEAKKERKGKQIQSEEMGHEDSATGPVIHDVTEMFTEDSSYLGSAAAAFMEQPQVQSPPASKSPFSDNPLLGGTDNSPLVYGLDPPINGQLDTENGTGEQKDAPTAAVKDVTPQGPNVEITSTASKAAMRTPATTDFSEPQQKTPTTYYLQSADGTVQPVQVVLSIPETPPTTKTQTGSTATNTTSSQGASLPDTPIPSTSFDMVPVIARNQTVDCMSPHFNKKPKYHTDEFDGHLDDMQIGLDNLRDILQNDEYKMDPSMLLGLFGENDLGYSELAKLQNAEGQAANNGTHTNPLIGQELVSYNPSLFELTEEDSQFFDDSTNILLDDELESMLTTEKSKLNKSQTKEESVVGLGGGLTTPVGSTPPILGIPSHLSIPTTTIGTSSSASGAGKRKRK